MCCLKSNYPEGTLVLHSKGGVFRTDISNFFFNALNSFWKLMLEADALRPSNHGVFLGHNIFKEIAHFFI